MIYSLEYRTRMQKELQTVIGKLPNFAAQWNQANKISTHKVCPVQRIYLLMSLLYVNWREGERARECDRERIVVSFYQHQDRKKDQKATI